MDKKILQIVDKLIKYLYMNPSALETLGEITIEIPTYDDDGGEIEDIKTGVEMVKLKLIISRNVF